jgi:hypothetical protein
MEIIKWSKSLYQKGVQFLEKNKEYSLFLLSNLNLHGFEIGEHANSGNYYIMYKDQEIIGVFCLTNRKNLLITCDSDKYPKEVVHFLNSNENIQIQGVLGKNNCASSIWDYLIDANTNLSQSYNSNEILYLLNKEKMIFFPSENCKLQSECDFETYYDYLKLYYLEIGLSGITQTIQKQKELYLNLVKEQYIWGHYLNSELTSMSQINGKYNKMAQVGGVFTPIEYRRNGYSKECMSKLIEDCLNIHEFNEIILFTAEQNTPARKVYESLGFKNIGNYGLYLGTISD